MKLFLDRMQRTNGTLVADLHEIRPELFNDPDPQLPYVMNVSTHLFKLIVNNLGLPAYAILITGNLPTVTFVRDICIRKG